MAPLAARMPPTHRFALRPLPVAAALALCATGAVATPQGGVVQAGAATITASGNRVDIRQSSQRAVIDWRSFSIGAGGQVNFQHPSPSGATLNRVTGPEVSAILGRLTANGTVFLVNPNGILIGPGAKIDVGGLVAATANLSNENFMAGRYKFDEVVNRNAVIVNRGEITAHAGGLVALVAPGVENSGVIRAELGRVVLASGNRFTLDPFGDRLITFAIDDKVAARLTDVDGRPLTAYVNQTGTIEAGGGSILIAASVAKAVLDNVINTSGVVRATSFAQRGGEIVLAGGDEGVVRVAGTLDAAGRAPGATGGVVKVLGAEVVLGAGSRVDVAGDAGGGTVFVGGGVQGGGGLQRSSRTVIEAGATVSADAVTSGNGGTIVAWSDGATRFAGALSARGGAGGGDGGFVEVSGKRELAFAGAVDAGAPAGKGGRLLLDPELLIVDAATANSAANALRSGTRVDLEASNAIEVREPIDGRGGASGAPLTLTAGNRIAVDNDIVTNDGEVRMTAGAGGIAMGRGRENSVTGGDGTVVYTGAAPITLRAGGNVEVEHLVTTAAVDVTSTAGTVVFRRDLGGSLGSGIASLSTSAGQGITLNGVNASGPVIVTTTGPDGSITVEGPIKAGGDVTLGGAARADTTTIWLRNDIFTANADIVLNGTTMIDPVVQAGEANVTYSRLFRLSRAARFYEAPGLQVSLETNGSGSIRLNGPVLWGGDPTALPEVRYIYNQGPPFDTFNRLNQTHVQSLRATQDPLPTGYFGLNLRVDRGDVWFGGNVGMFTKSGDTKYVPAAETLDEANLGTALRLTVQSGTYSRLALPEELKVGFAPGANVLLGRFWIENPAGTSLDRSDVQQTFFARPPATLSLLPNRGNMPRPSVTDTGPNLLGPSPRNAPAAPAFASIGPFTPERSPERAAEGATAFVRSEAPASGGGQPTATEAAATGGESASTSRTSPAVDSTHAVVLRAGGARLDASGERFASGEPLVPFASGRLHGGVDAEYFTLGPFEFLQARERRAASDR